MRLAWLAALPLALAPAGALAEEDLAVVRAEEGYRLTRPDGRWRVRETAVPATAHHALRLERAPGPGEVTLTVYQADAAAGATADALVATAAQTWKARAVGTVAIGTSTVAGAAAPTITWDMDMGGARLHVRQHFLVRDGQLLVVQCVAPAAAFASHEGAFASALASLAFLPPDPARTEAQDLRRLAARCGSEVPRARTWAEAAARAARERRLVLVAFEMYRGLPIPPLADTTTFMDDDLVALCRERLVVLPWSDAIDAPFRDPAAYGIGPHTFGQGVLFVTPDGRVVGSLGLLEPSLVEERARAALAASPEAVGAPWDADDAGAALGRGDLARADELLKAPTTAAAWRQRAALARRRHLVDDALAALDRAGEGGADAKEVAADRGLVLLRAGRVSEAIESLRAAGNVPSARYWLAVARAVREGVAPVRADLLLLAADASAGRVRWRAAALALGRGPATGMEAVVWPDAAVREAAGPRAYEPVAPTEAARAATDALAFLLRTQRADGTWALPMAFAADPAGSVTVATTAIAGSALLRHRGRPDVDAAVERAHAAVARAHPRLLRSGHGVFDYTVWAQIFALRFLAASVRGAPADEAARLRASAAEIADALVESRAPSGGWSYANLAGAGLSADNSISFVTAAGLLSLCDARTAGVSLPPAAIAPSAGVVLSLRRKDGTFAYQTASPGIGDPTEAALRGPLCLLALRRAEHRGAAGPSASTDDVGAALAAVVAVRDAALREAGKPLCHTAPDGTSAYYLLFGLRFAAEALRELPREARAPLRRGLLDAVLRLRRADGSFSDFGPVGPAYGSAMALEALDLLE